MDQIRDSLDETAFPGVHSTRRNVKVFAKSISRAQIRFESDDPGLQPAYCTRMGRVLLASWDKKSVDAYLIRTRLRAPTPRTVIDRGKPRAILAKVAADGLCRSRGGICARWIGDGGAGTLQ